MRKFLYFFIGMWLIIFIVSYFILRNEQNYIKEKFAKKYYNEIYKEYNLFFYQQSHLLLTSATYLATDKTTLQAYKKDNPSLIKDKFLHFFNTFKNQKAIDSIHFFKFPTKNFLNFNNLQTKQVNLAAIRKDIFFTTPLSKPYNYFYTCRHLVGIRSTVQIKDNQIYGSVSTANNITKFKTFFEKLGYQTSIYLNDHIIKNKFFKKVYLQYAKHPLYNGFRVIGKVYKIDLETPYNIQNNNLFVSIPIKDIFENTLGYIVVKKETNLLSQSLKKLVKKVFIIEVISFILSLILLVILFKYINYKLNLLKTLSIDTSDEFKEVQDHFIAKENECKKSIDSLKEEIHNLKEKLYKDKTTHLYNKFYLEDHIQELKDFKIISLKILNLNEFKDQMFVLTQFISAIETILSDEIFARIDKNQFVILSKNEELAKTLNETMKNLKIYNVEGVEIKKLNVLIQINNNLEEVL